MRRALASALVGRRVVSARVHRRDAVVAPGDPPGGFGRSTRAGRAPARPTRLTSSALLAGGQIRSVERHGKQLALITTDGRAALIHLGMTGQVRVLAPGTRLEVGPGRAGAHAHVTWRVADPEGASGGRVVFCDPRRFGGVWAGLDEAGLRERWARLGPDGLGVTGAMLRARLGGSARAIKAALLDQAVVAGVGNIYADEALFGAGVAPTRAARDLSESEADALASALVSVFRAALEAGGSTLRDYRAPDGTPGRATGLHRVYGRGGEACGACGGVLTRTQVAQRTTVFCPVCQC